MTVNRRCSALVPDASDIRPRDVVSRQTGCSRYRVAGGGVPSVPQRRLDGVVVIASRCRGVSVHRRMLCKVARQWHVTGTLHVRSCQSAQGPPYEGGGAQSDRAAPRFPNRNSGSRGGLPQSRQRGRCGGCRRTWRAWIRAPAGRDLACSGRMVAGQRGYFHAGWRTWLGSFSVREEAARWSTGRMTW